MSARESHKTAGSWIVRSILRLYPSEFRDTYEKDLEQAVGDRMRAVGAGRIRIAALMLKEVLSLIKSLPDARSHSRRNRRRGRNDMTAHARGAGLMLDRIRQDMLFSIRTLRRSPLFTATVLLTLCLGVGATTSMFSVVNGVLLKPLPYPDQDRIVAIATRWADHPDRFNPMSRPDIIDLTDLSAFQAVAGYATGSDVLLRDGSATVVSSALITSGLLAPFGLHPQMGRDITIEESEPGSPLVVVVSHSFWVNELGSDPNVLGSTLELNEEIFEVIGVAPVGFDFPARTKIWRAHINNPDICGRGCHNYQGVGLTVPTSTVEQARQQSVALADRLAQEYPVSNLEKSFHVRSMEEHLLGGVRQELWVLLGAVSLVLLIACANVANLLLARARERVAEMGVRSSLGAGRRRLTFQLFTESVVLAGLGGGLGLVLAYVSTAFLRRLSTANIPRVEQIAVDANVVLFTVGVVVLVAVVFGLSPALHLAQLSPVSALQTTARGERRSRIANRFRHLLLVSEMGLSVLLLVGAGLLVRTLSRINQIQPGFQIEDVSRFDLVLPTASYADLQQVTQFYQELEDRIDALPDVSAVGSAYGAPMGGWGTTGWVLVSGRPEPERGEETSAALRAVTPKYLAAYGIPVLRGRGIQQTDDAGNLPVALVNEAFIRENFPGQDPLGEQVRITVTLGFGSPTWTIIGVVPDVRSASLTRAAYPEIYVPHSQMGSRRMTIVVRSRPGSPPPLTAIRTIVSELDAGVPLRNVVTMDQLMRGQTAVRRFYLLLLSIFAVLAMVLASVGLYGVIAYLVTTQRREIGIRLALGSQREGVVRMVLLQAAKPTLFGLIVGIAGATAVAPVLERFLFQVNPRDPLVYATVASLLLAVAAFSAFLPAHQASLVDPGEVLRGE